MFSFSMDHALIKISKTVKQIAYKSKSLPRNFQFNAPMNTYELCKNVQTEDSSALPLSI